MLSTAFYDMSQAQLLSIKVDHYIKIISYCYQLFNVIKNVLFQSDCIKKITQYIDEDQTL